MSITKCKSCVLLDVDQSVVTAVIEYKHSSNETVCINTTITNPLPKCTHWKKWGCIVKRKPMFNLS